MTKNILEAFFILSTNPWWYWGLLVTSYLLGSLLVLRLVLLMQQQSVVLNPWKRRKTRWSHSKLTPVFVSFLGWSSFGLLLGFWWYNLVGMVIGLGLGFGVAWAFGQRAKRRAQQAVSQQLPLLLRALGSTLKAGYSVPQALEFVVLEAEEPLRSKLAGGAKALKWQQPLELVLDDWRRTIKVPEFKLLADSLLLQSRSGGNLVALCHRVARLLEERHKLERDIQSFTAQGKMSGYLMAGLWPVSLLLFAWLAPHHTEVLFHTRPGHVLLGLSIGLELVGFYFIWRLVRVQV